MSYIMVDIEADRPCPGDYLMDTSKNFKHLRRTKHTHHPVDNARGNAEAFLELIKQYHLNV